MFQVRFQSGAHLISMGREDLDSHTQNEIGEAFSAQTESVIGPIP